MLALRAAGGVIRNFVFADVMLTVFPRFMSVIFDLCVAREGI